MADKRRVSLVYMDTPMSGVKRYSMELLVALLRRGHAVVPQPIRGREFNVLGRRVGGLLSYRLSRALTRSKEPIVHATNPTALTRDANVVTIHDLILLKYAGQEASHVLRMEERDVRAASRLPLILTPTAHVKRDVVERYGVDPERVVVTPEGINHDVFYPDPQRPDAYKPGGMNLLVLGELNPRKRVDIVVEALEMLDRPDIRLYHAGAAKGPAAFETALQRKVADLQKAGRYIHLGPIMDDALLRRLYGHADLLVAPSLDEGFGFPPLEAMACGTNALVSDIPPFRENLSDHVTYAPLTAEGFAKGIEVALKHGKPRETLIAHARAFTWDRCADVTADAYGRVTGA